MRKLLTFAIGFSIFAVTQSSSHASVFTINLTGDPASGQIYNSNDGESYTGLTVFLSDSMTRSGQIPQISFSVGDTLAGTVTFTSPITIPASAADDNNFPTIVLNVFSLDQQSLGAIIDNQNLSFYDDGVLVALPDSLNLTGINGTNGGLALVGYSVIPTSEFFFNSIVYSADITQLFDSNSNPVMSGTVNAPGDSYFNFTAYPPELPAAVPEPATWALMISGFGAIGAMLRKRQRVSFS